MTCHCRALLFAAASFVMLAGGGESGSAPGGSGTPSSESGDPAVSTPAELPDAYSNDFSVYADFTESASNPDPHENRYVFVVDDRNVYYDGPYGEHERGRYQTKTVEFQLSEDQKDTLLEIMRRYELLQSIDVERGGRKPSVDVGQLQNRRTRVRSFEGEATIVVDSERYELQISGLTSAHPDEFFTTLGAHERQADGLEQLGSKLKSFAE